MPKIADEELTRLKKEIDLVKLVQASGVELKPQGKNWIGLCPFHNDTNPSLIVTPKKNLWNCLGACGEGGSVIDWVMKTQNLDFKQAVHSLQTGNQNPASPPPIPEITFDHVCDYYHKKLYDHKKALGYLKQRGFDQPELYSRFKIGFVDQSLIKRLSLEQITVLKKRGLIRRNSQEHFLNCLTVPLCDENNQTVGFYGRCINPKSLIKHLYLKDQHQGIFNRKASQVFDQIILTESILDALSLIHLGIDNVQSLYGTNGLTDFHLNLLKQDRVKQVILALDNDVAGRQATEKLKLSLEEEGFQVTAVFPGQKDWNEELTKGEAPKGIRKQLEKLFVQPSSTAQKPKSATYFTHITQESLGTLFHTPDVIYKVTGIKELFVASLKVGIKITQASSGQEEGESYYDSLDLYAAKSRGSYSRDISRLFGLEPKAVEKDLIHILEYLEEERDRQLLNKDQQKKQSSLTPEEEKLGMTFLKDPDLFNVISQDLDTLGYTGEELNKQLLYLAASSRLMDDPISVIIQSQSASGKSKLVETIETLLPEEDVVSITSLSDQALNYADDLKHKFLSLGEAVHSEVVEHQIREMLSAKKLSRLVTLKDAKTGKMVSKQVITPAIVAAVITATGYTFNPENASRNFLTNIDESKEQTRKIHHKQRSKYSPVRYYEKKEKIPHIIKKHRSAQRLLKKRVIFNRFADLIDFPDSLIRTRRDHERFIDLISAICFLRQYQKPLQNDGKTTYIDCDLTDYELAYKIMIQGVLQSSLEEIPQGSRKLYEALKELAATKATTKKLNVHEIRFTQREIREFTGWTQNFVHRHLRVLITYEYVIRAGGGSYRSKGYYRLIAGDDMEALDLSMIPNPKTMKKRLKN